LAYGFFRQIIQAAFSGDFFLAQLHSRGNSPAGMGACYVQNHPYTS
jgi:hypothetical protein